MLDFLGISEKSFDKIWDSVCKTTKISVEW